jgi:hypothetical protein
MPFFGELERFAATTLYPWRLPIAALTIAAAVGLVLLAARRGWLAAARRHPVRSFAVAAVLLAVLAPAGWYLGSPLFIRAELVEPTAAALVASPGPSRLEPSTGSQVGSPSGSMAASMAPPSAPPGPTPSPVVHAGTFVGADDFHFGHGQATLVVAPDGSATLRFDGFSVRNGPDLYVYLSPDPKGYADGAIELGRLRATDGSFNTPIPAGTDVRPVRSVVIWCKQFSVQFAVAALAG